MEELSAYNRMMALRLGIIDWFEYFELVRGVVPEKRIERKAA